MTVPTNTYFACLGYNLRKHIAKALQARSKAARAALDHYNAAAKEMNPPQPTLEWKDVINYAFLSEFDLLRGARQDVRTRPWARPASRMAMDLYFKIQRAKEEIERLNIEIPRVVTHIRDERQFLLKKEAEYWESHPILSHQIKLYRMERCRFDAQHMRRFKDIARLPGFTGTITP